MDAALLGSVLLWAAGAAAAAATISPLRMRPRLLLQIAVLLAALAVAVLGWALLAVDLSLEYVAQVTSRATPWPYRLAGLWGGMDGSMLFYTAMTAAVAWFAFRRSAVDLAVRLAAGAAAALLLFTALFASPFGESGIPAVDGVGLLAILQHPAMLYHPPLLYLGLTTLLIPFSLTASRALQDRSGEGPPRAVLDDWVMVRRWLLVSWMLLTFGMVAGSSWAYVELGWGGFWAWDPVENTALMPWLATTAWLHTSRITRRDGRLARATAALAMIPFALSVLGVYLTRSGITGSIHAFAEDPVIGRILLVAAVAIAVAVLAMAAASRAGPGWGAVGAGRDSWLAANAILVTAVLVFVIVGSAYPAYALVFFEEDVVIDSRFFVLTVFPLAVMLLVGLALGLRTTWSRPPPLGDWPLLGGGAVGLTAVVLLAVGPDSWAPALGVGLGAAAVAAVSIQLASGRSRQTVALLAHLGLTVVITAAAGSALGSDFSGTMRPGESIQVGSHQVTLESISTGEADRFSYARASFLVDGARTLAPEIRGYEEQTTPVAEPALWSTPGRDITIAISLLFPDANAVEVSVFVRPLVWWVWLGALLTGLAGLLALLGRDEVAAAPRRSATVTPRSEETASGRSAR